MKQKLLCLGDSFCASPNGWPSHLANLLDADFISHGIGGQCWYNIVDWMDQHPDDVARADIIVFAHTNAERIPTSNLEIGKINHSKVPETEIEHAVKLYYKHIYCHDFLRFAQKLWFKHITDTFSDKTLVHLHCFPGHTVEADSLLTGISIQPPLSVVSMMEKDACPNVVDARNNHFSEENNLVLAQEIFYAIQANKRNYTLNIDNFVL